VSAPTGSQPGATSRSTGTPNRMRGTRRFPGPPTEIPGTTSIPFSLPDPAAALAQLRTSATALRRELDAIEAAAAALETVTGRPAADGTLLTVAETAAVLRTSRRTVFQLVKDGELDAVHLGRETTVTHVSIDALVARRAAACLAAVAGRRPRTGARPSSSERMEHAGLPQLTSAPRRARDSR
jgi:excisionase family DNA binding protein